MRLLTQDEINEFRRTPGSFDAMVQAIHDHGWAEGRASAPAWHPAPDAPGLWRASSTETLKRIDEWNISAYQRTGVRWYGPLPDDGGKA